MDLEEFLQEYERLAEKGWRIVQTDRLRLSKEGIKPFGAFSFDSYCPITAVVKELHGVDFYPIEWPKAIRVLNMDRRIAWKILAAVDAGPESTSYNSIQLKHRLTKPFHKYEDKRRHDNGKN